MAFRLSTKRFGLVTPRPGSAATLPSALSQLRSAQNRLASTYAEAKGQGASTATGNDADSDKPRRPSRKGNYKPKRSFQKSARGPRQNFGADGAFVARPLFRNPPGTQAKYIEDRERYVLDTYSRPKIVMNQGIGAMLYDLEGKGYIDFTSGIGVANLGHYDEGFATKVKKQVNLLVHSSNLFHNYHAPTLCRLLVQLTQAQAANTRISRAFLSNSGTEANEAAIKFARKYAKSAHSSNPSKYEIVSFNGSFHGRTFGSLSATPNPKYSDPFEPLVPGFKVGNFNDVDAIDSLVTENTAGVIVEPVQGEGGIYVATPEFLHKLRARCDEVGAVLIYDEIQCGLSRTGSFWAHCHVRLGKEGVDPATKFAVPDILTSAKALANGLPIGATLVSEEIAQHIKPGDHGTTFGGNPLIATAASYVADRLSSFDILSTARQRGWLFRTQLGRMQEMFPTAIEDVRGLGLMLGVQLTDKYKGKVGDIVTEARNNGVLVLSAGNGVIRLLPVLNVGYVKSMTGLKALESAIAKVVKETEGLDPVHVEQHGSLKEPSVAELQASANPEVPEDAEQAQEGEPLEAAQETQQESEPAEATQEAQQEGEPAEATQEAQQEGEPAEAAQETQQEGEVSEEGQEKKEEKKE